MRILQHTYFRFGIALSFVGIALGLSLLSHKSMPESFLFFFLAAVMLAGWFWPDSRWSLCGNDFDDYVGYYFILHTAPLQWSSMNFHTSSRFCPAHW